MKLKKEIPTYQVGDIVTILDDINLRDKKYALDISPDGPNGEMRKLGNKKFTIRSVSNNSSYVRLSEMQASSYAWSINMFKESYELEEEQDIIEPYVGMYLYHHNFDIKRDGLTCILLQVKKITNNHLYCKYIYSNSKVILDINIENYDKHYCSYEERLNIRNVRNKNYITDLLYIPDNEELMKEWRVKNKDVNKKVLKEGMLQIPNFFEHSKYPIKRLNIYSEKDNTRRENYYFVINNKTFVTFDKNKMITYNNYVILTDYGFKEADIKNVITNWAKVRIKSYENSANLFLHKARKKAMFEARNIGPKSGKEFNVKYEISNIIFNYEKDGKFYHVLEINDGTLKLKFLLDDLEIILPNCNNHNIPIDRKIKEGDECKIKIVNKFATYKKNTKVKILELRNKHQPVGSKRHDGSTIALVVNDKKEKFECKLKQLKKI